jgi:hypothetical protein
MSTFGTEEAAGALEAIAEVGQAVSFERENRIWNSVDEKFEVRWSGEPNLITFTGIGVRLTTYKGIQFNSMDDAFKAQLIRGQALGLIISASGMENTPKPDDILILADGTRWLTKGVTTLNPAGVPIIHTIGAVQT